MILEALQQVRALIPSGVTLIAVSKTKPVSDLMIAYEAGQRVFGENYVQEICEKARLMPSDVQWHFIGHLQSNKAKQLVTEVPTLAMVESVDRLKIAQALDKACEAVNRGQLDVMVEVNTSGEESKSGCEPHAAESLIEEIEKTCPRLKIRGLMTIGSPQPDPADRDFTLLKSIRDDCEVKFGRRFELSMGMSNDFQLAIASGSTAVRVGSAIFGSRQYFVAPSAVSESQKVVTQATP